MFWKKKDQMETVSSLKTPEPSLIHFFKAGLLYWSWDKNATIIQCAYAVLLPRTLVLYKSEADFQKNRETPFNYLDLETCLVVQQTDIFSSHLGFMILLVPGGVKLFGCENESERNSWISHINLAMDVDVPSQELRELINKFSENAKLDNAIVVKESQIDESILDEIQTPPSPVIVTTETRPEYCAPPADLNSKERVTLLLINEVTEDNTGNDLMAASLQNGFLENESTEMDKDKEKEDGEDEEEEEKEEDEEERNGLHETACDCLSSDSGMDEVGGILRQLHPLLFDDKNMEMVEIENKTNQKGYDSLPIRLSNKSVNESTTIFEEIKSLTSMLQSQETAYSLLYESCICLKDTITKLQKKLMKHKIQISPSNFFIPTLTNEIVRRRPATVKRNPTKVVSAEWNENVFRRRNKTVRKPGQTNSLIEIGTKTSGNLTPEYLWRSSFAASDTTLIAPNDASGSLISRKSTMETLPQPEINAEITPTKPLASMSCVHCLRPALHMILATAASLPATDEVLDNLTRFSHHLCCQLRESLLFLRSQFPYLPGAEITERMARFVCSVIEREEGRNSEMEYNPDTPFSIMLTMVFNATIEICGHIVGQEEQAPTGNGNDSLLENIGLKADAFTKLLEKGESGWLLPGYLSISMMIQSVKLRLKVAKQEKYETFTDVINEEGNSENVRKVLESLSIMLIQTLNRLRENHEKEDMDCSIQNTYFNETGQLHFGSYLMSLIGQLQNNQTSSTSLYVKCADNDDSDHSLRRVNAYRLFESGLGSSSNKTQSTKNIDSIENNNKVSTGVIPRPTQEAQLSLVKQRREFYEQFSDLEHEKESETVLLRNDTDKVKIGDNCIKKEAVQDENQHVIDYLNLKSALQKQYEEEKKMIWDHVRANWRHLEFFEAYSNESELQLRTLHTQLSRIIETQGSRNSMNDKSSEYSNSDFTNNNPKDLIRQSHFILLGQVENAFNVFSELVTDIEDHQITKAQSTHHGSVELEDDDEESVYPGNIMSKRITQALASLSAAATDLKARLYSNEFEGVEEDEKEMPSEEADITLIEDIDKYPPAPPGFVLHLSSPFEKGIGLESYDVSDESEI